MTAEEFLNEHHLQGSIKSNISVGLYYNNELVSVGSFGKRRISCGGKNDINTYELLRFCSVSTKIIRGGLSKLLKYFIKIYNPSLIISYADKRWGDGGSYEKVGFKLVNTTFPGYWYVKVGDDVRKHRFGFRKSVLSKKLPLLIWDTAALPAPASGGYRIISCRIRNIGWLHNFH